MANTYTEHTGNGSTTTYAIPVSDWISDSHIIVQLDADGTRYDVDTVGAYSFSINGSDIEFDVAPASDVKFIVMRDTLGKDYDDTALDYDFTDGSVVTGDQLDGAYRHGLFLAQEAADLAFRKAALTDNSVLAYDLTTEQWESLPLNLNYDSTTGFFGIGGAHDAGYKYKFHGDILIEDGTGEATLRVRHTGSGGTDSATIRLEADAPTVVWEDNAGDTDEKFLHAGYTDGTLSFAFYDDAGESSYAIPLQLTTNGSVGGVVLDSLPTSDPSVTGQLWNRNGAVVLSGAAEGRLEQLLGDVNITSDDLLQGDVLHWNDTSNKWEAIPLGLNYDSGTGFFGIGGTHDTAHKYKFHGDVLVEDSSATEATLRVRQVGSLAATIRLEADSPTVVWKDDAAATDESFMHLGYGSGALALASYNDDATLKNILMTFGTDGEISMFNLPTTDPLVAGQLWTDNNEVKVSTGSAVSRYIYDSGWSTTWGGVTLAAQATGYETLSATQDAYYPFQVTVWGRDATTPDIVYPINISPQAREDATDTVGIYSWYDTTNKRLLFIFQDNALIAEGASAGIRTTVPWGTIDEIRVTIT